MSTVWLHEIHSAEGRRFRIGRQGDTRVAEWDGMLRLEVQADGTAHVEAAEESLGVRKLRQGAVPALLGHLTGDVHWHASACAWQRGPAVVVLGDAGAGKSTLVAGLCGAGGAAFLADDVAHVAPTNAGWEVRRCETKHAVRPDMAAQLFGRRASGKILFAPGRTRKRARLGAWLGLEVGAELALTALSPRAKVQLLTRNLVRFALDDPERLQRDLDLVLRLVGEVPMYALVRPAIFSDWQALANLLQTRLHGVLEEKA